MDVKSKIQLPIKAELEAFKKFYSAQFNSDVVLLNKALAHVADSSGKMMRPMLVLLAAKSLGEVNEKTFLAASALELLHTASLLHDDVVDESDMRRGKPSLNALYSNRIAILTGDYLFSSSLFNAAKTKNNEIIEILSSLGRTLSEGEMLQLELQKSGGYNEERYFNVIRCKTAVLFATCACFGSLSVNADKNMVDNFTRFGELLGICFQLKDDIFDYYKTDIGKPTGSDIREGKITLPALYVLNKVSSPAVEQIKNKLENSNPLADDEIDLLIELSKSRGGVEYAQKKIDEYYSEALSLIPFDIPDDCRQALIAYLDYVVARDK